MDIALSIVVILILIVGTFMLKIWLVKRAIAKIIAIMRKHNAVSAQTAKSAKDLGLEQKPFRQRLMTLRDYKPNALKDLINAGIVLMNEDGTVYLSEEKLSNTVFRKVS